MNTGRVAAGVIFALAIPVISLHAQSSASPAPAAPAGMMMSSCEHHQAMTAALASMEKLVVDTKSSKDITALHAALEQIGLQVTKIQESQKKCAGMMEMMEKMKSMPQKEPPQHQHQ